MRFPAVARRDARISELERTAKRQAALEERSFTEPSFHRYIHADRRLAGHLLDLGRGDRGQVITHKLKSYAFAQSHGVDVPRLFGVWDHPDDIAWDQLPDHVVIKSVRGTAARGVKPLRREAGRWTTVTTTKPIEPSEIVARLRAHETADVVSGPYFAEELLGGGIDNLLPVDVKVHAFYGEVTHVLLRRVLVHGDPTVSTFRVVFPDGSDAGPVVRGLTHDEDIPVPGNLADVCGVAARLSLGIPRAYVRIDMYDVDGRIVFGELTPRPGEPMYYGAKLDTWLGHVWERAQARVQSDLLDGAEVGLRFGTGPRELVIGARPYVPTGV
jgi:hypothetical protein